MKPSLEDQAMSQGLCATNTLLNFQQDEKCSVHHVPILSVDWSSFSVWLMVVLPLQSRENGWLYGLFRIAMLGFFCAVVCTILLGIRSL